MTKKHKRTESEHSCPHPWQNLPQADHKKKMKKGRDGSNELEPKKEEEHRLTVSKALPSSIIDNTQSLELATRLVGEVARAATIFRIEEVVVFDSKDTQEMELLMELMTLRVVRLFL